MIFGDISPRTTAYADRRLLTRITPNNILGQFGQSRTIPSKSSSTVKFRRYNRLAVATSPLTEGVTPTGKTLTNTDVTATLKQYGDFITITDVIEDTHEDPVLKESIDILGEQAAETWDVLRAGVLVAGTNVQYTAGSARNAVNVVVTKAMLSKAIRTLKRQETKPITSIVQAGPNIATNPIPAAYVMVCHSDAQTDLEAMTGWIPIANYASNQGKINGEVGSIGEIRVVFDNNLVAWADAGTTKGATISTSGTNSDVYPLLIFGKDAYGVVTLAGKTAVSTYVNNPKPSDTDPLAQRGTVGWKGYNATVILQQAAMLRLETALTA